MSETKQFDVKKEFDVPTIDGKRCVVRFPTDEEWCDRARRMKTIRRDLGRDKSRYEAQNAKKVDGELFDKIRVDKDGTPFDESEASYVVDRLDRAKVETVEREGQRYRVSLKVPGAITTHVLKVPKQALVDEYSEASDKTIFGRNMAEIRVVLEPAGKLYDAIAEGSEGYAHGVPVIHKVAAVSAVLRDIAMRLDDDDPED